MEGSGGGGLHRSSRHALSEDEAAGGLSFSMSEASGPRGASPQFEESSAYLPPKF